MPVIYDIGEAEAPPLPAIQDDILATDDSDTSTDSEDTTARASLNRAADTSAPKAPAPQAANADFLLTGLALSASSTALAIFYPMYVRSVVRVSNTFVAVLCPSSACMMALIGISSALKCMGRLDGIALVMCPLPDNGVKLSIGSLCYVVGCALVVLAQTPGRVSCHLQDPLKAVVILFSLLYYFIFCKKMMGLRKLFAASVLAVGLFIAADYGLCDEFKCRGTEDHIDGPWEVRASWTVLYLMGLGLFTLHYTLTEDFLSNKPSLPALSNISVAFLSTVSSSVENTEICDRAFAMNSESSQELVAQETDVHKFTEDLDTKERTDKKLCIFTTFWTQAVTWIFCIISGCFILLISNTMTEYISPEALLNDTISGVVCHIPHFTMQESVEHKINSLPPRPVTEYPQMTNIFTEETNNGKSAHEIAIERKRILGMFSSHRQRNYTDQPQKENTYSPKLNIYNKFENRTEDLVFENDPLNRSRRPKRSAAESLASGFKIITPTISLLKDHVITNKMKPNLIGHVILNKTNANINGHHLAPNPGLISSDIEYHRRGGQNVMVESDDNPDTYDTAKEPEKPKAKRSHQRYKRSGAEFLNASSQELFHTRNSLNFYLSITRVDSNDCVKISRYGWTVFFAYTTFAITSIRFLKLCQSSVFTIAMMTPALPLAGVWWAIFTNNPEGELSVEPTMSGELICSLLSLPIIILGLTLLFKAQLNQTLCGKTTDVNTINYDSRFTSAPKTDIEGDVEYELSGRN